MRHNLNLFNTSPADLLAQAGFTPDQSADPANFLHFKLERLFDLDTQCVVTVSTRKLHDNMEPRCLEHIARKFAGSHHDKKQKEATVLEAPMCRFALGAFDYDMSKISSCEGYSDAQALLHFQLQQESYTPIVMDVAEKFFVEDWEHEGLFPSMSKTFRNEHFDMLVHLMNCLPLHTVIGNAIKMTHGIYDPHFIDSEHLPTWEDLVLLPEMQNWRLNGKTITSEDLLATPGQINEANLLMVCWKMLERKRRVDASLNQRRA